MVKSGLVDEPSVSQYRLAAHLGLAVAIYGMMLYTAASMRPRAVSSSASAGNSGWLPALVFITMIWGAFMSGLDGGAVFNTFPLMDGRLFPPGALSMVPVWLNLFENIGLVQWLHRVLAIVTVVAVLWAWWRDRQAGSAALNLLTAFALLQFGLGIVTILSGASIYIAWAHQGGAMVLFSAAIWRWQETRSKTEA